MDYLKQARAADAFFEPSWYRATLGAAHFIARQYDEAITAIKRGYEASAWSHALLAAAHAHRGDDAEARRHAAEVLRLAPNFSIAKSLKREPLKREADREHLVEG
jgi:adenylate cyclase